MQQKRTQCKINPGIYAASLTPIKADLTCDFQTLAEHCQDLLNRGCQGIVLFGTTGEGTSFTVAERIEALKQVINRGIDPSKLLMGVSSPALTDAVNLAQASIVLGCKQLLVLPSFFYKNISDVGVIAFYREFIKRVASADFQIILYHIPQHSGVHISLKVIEVLHHEYPDTVVGIKESEGNFTLAMDILKKFPNFQLFMGNETMIAEAVRQGGSGGINGLTNAFPELLSALYEHGKDPNKPDRQQEIVNLVAEFKSRPFIPSIKHYMELKQGRQWHHVRPPLVALDSI